MIFSKEINEIHIFLTFAKHSVFLGKITKTPKSQQTKIHEKLLPQNPPGRVKRKQFLRERTCIHTQTLNLTQPETLINPKP